MLGKAKDIGQQKKSQWQQPEEWHAGHILAELVGGRKKKGRGGSRQQEPENPQHGFWKMLRERGLFRLFGPRRASNIFLERPFSEGKCQPEGAEDHDHETRRPAKCLLPEAKEGFNGKGIAHESQEGSEIGEGIEGVWRFSWEQSYEPGLHQGAVGGQHKIGKPHASKKNKQNQEGRVDAVIRLPIGGRGDRQQAGRSHQYHDMNEHLMRRGKPVETEMGVGIAQQEHELKKKHAGRPDAGSSSKPGQNEFSNQRLHLEEEKRCGKDLERKKEP